MRLLSSFATALLISIATAHSQGNGDHSHPDYPNLELVLYGINRFLDDPIAEDDPTLKYTHPIFTLSERRDNSSGKAQFQGFYVSTLTGGRHFFSFITTYGKYDELRSTENEASNERYDALDLGYDEETRKELIKSWTRSRRENRLVESPLVKETQAKFGSGRSVVIGFYISDPDLEVAVFDDPTPPYHPDFLNYLMVIRNASNSSRPDQLRIFKTFVDRYGTHYYERCVIGDRFTLVGEYDRSDLTEHGPLGEEAGCWDDIDIWEWIGRREDLTCVEFRDQAAGGRKLRATSRPKGIVRGSRFLTFNGSHFANDSKGSVVIIADVVPVPYLWNERLLAQQNVTGVDKADLLWFLRLFANYCSSMNQYREIMNETTARLDCSDNSNLVGCGYTDRCMPEEVCRDTGGGTFVCSGRTTTTGTTSRSSIQTSRGSNLDRMITTSTAALLFILAKN